LKKDSDLENKVALSKINKALKEEEDEQEADEEEDE
jgi:hypothetical protein